MHPLHYKRFARRTSVGKPLAKPETPIYRSLPDDDPTIHAPKPTKSFPTLQSPSPVSTATKQPSTWSSFLSPLVTPASFLHGTKTQCVRHGRQAVPQDTAKKDAKPASSARDMLTKSRSGTYLPTGLMQMRQVDATSPWALPARKLTATDSQSDACPDCIGELKIKRRELMQGSPETTRRTFDDSSKTVRSFTPKQSSTSMTYAFSVLKDVNKATYEIGEGSLVLSKDLGDGLEAVVVQHRGLLRRVMLNTRRDKPSNHTVQRLSKELVMVSNELASVETTSSPTRLTNPGDAHDYSMILAAPPRVPHDARTSSVPELLNLIDQAANEIHHNTGRVAEHYISRPDLARMHHHSLLSATEFDNVIGDEARHEEGLVSRQDIDGHYHALHQRLANAPKTDTVQPDDSTSPSTERYSTPSQPALLPSTAPAPKVSNISSDAPPRIITTKPTMPAMSNPQTVSPTAQTPPPEHPSLHHAVEIAESPSSSAPALLTPKPPASGHHSPFNFLNPFHRPVAPTTPASPQPPQQAQPPPQQPTPTPTNTSTSRVRPADESPPATTPQPISNVPNPYHHAPHEPLDLTHAAYADPKLKAQQQVIRAAMRMDQSKRVQEALSAMEREARRKRSLGVQSAAQPAAAGAKEGTKGGWGRKGWFG